MTSPVAYTPAKHGVIEDVLGILTGTFLASLGLFLLQSSGTVTGGTAGLALLLSYAIGAPFGVLFLGVNLPFFALGVRRKGWNFTIRTGLCVAVVAMLGSLHPAEITRIDIDPIYAALAGNLLAGVGLLVLFRHRSSLGGFNILALILQERRGLRAGYVQMILDVVIVAASLTVVAPLKVVGGHGILPTGGQIAPRWWPRSSPRMARYCPADHERMPVGLGRPGEERQGDRGNLGGLRPHG